MTISNASTLVEFDADGAVDALHDAAGDSLRLCIEYDSEEFTTLYADERTISQYETERELIDHFEEIFSYAHIDFVEKELFEDVLRVAGGVRSFVTYLDHLIIVRALVGQEGLFFAVGPDSNVTGLLETVETILR